MRLGARPTPAPAAAPAPTPAGPPDGPTPAAPLQLLASFLRNSIAAASGVAMDRANGAGNTQIGVELPDQSSMVSGWVFTVTAQLSGATGATSWTGEVYVNGNATGIKVTVTGTTVTRFPGRFPLNPGDVLTVVDSRVGAVSAKVVFVDVWGRLEQANAASLA